MVGEEIMKRGLDCYYRDNDIITSLPAQEGKTGITERKHDFKTKEKQKIKRMPYKLLEAFRIKKEINFEQWEHDMI